jgi:hypothetical protein
MTDANKTGQPNQEAAERAVKRTIMAINREMQSYVIASRDKTIAVAANATTVTLPTECRKVKELGRYDSGTDRIEPIYMEISERDFYERYSGVQTISAITPTDYQEWFFVDDTSQGAPKIRLVFPPNAAFTMMAPYFEKLTTLNADRLDDDDLIYNGAYARLPGWFPRDYFVMRQLFDAALDTMRAARRSIKRTVSIKTRADIAIHNAVGAYLTD